MKQLLKIPAWPYVISITLVGAILRWWDIAKASIWHDEGYTMMLAPMSPVQIVERTARDVHPPLYYIVLHYWMNIFGSSEYAARGLSMAFMVAAIPVAYLLVRRIWNESAARVAALFMAFGPFVIRYSQEARMYGMVGFLLLLSTYFLVRALEKNIWKWWILYAVTLAAALYTHYYSIFMIVVHWGYVASQTRPHRKDGLLNIRWWAANVLAAGLFLPWLPSAYAQFTRVQGSFWIPPVTKLTLPSTLIQFLTYGYHASLTENGIVAVGLGFAAILALAWWKAAGKRRSLWLLTLYTLVGPLLVFLLSYKRPIYVDRYFVFASIGFYCLLAVFVVLAPRILQIPAIAAVLLLSCIGIGVVHKDATHRMKDIGAYVNANYRQGDEILSGELYTFFDFSYYNHTGAQVHLWSKNGVNGYGESSLIYDRADQIVVEKLSDVHPASGRLWVVGKPGLKDYSDPTKIPANWKPVGAPVISADSSVQLYDVLPRSNRQVALQ